jgi:hypothetical protein
VAVETAEVKASAGNVVLASGERVPYVVLVLAPGSLWKDPLAIPATVPEMQAYVNEWRRKFKEARHVVFVGGGAVGIGEQPSVLATPQTLSQSSRQQNFI